MPSLFKLLFIAALAVPFSTTAEAETPRQIIAQALVKEDAEEQAKMVAGLAGRAEPEIKELLTAWKEGSIYIFEAPADLPGFKEGEKVPVSLMGAKDEDGKQQALR